MAATVSEPDGRWPAAVNSAAKRSNGGSTSSAVGPAGPTA
jgi:hypothetical protein